MSAARNGGEELFIIASNRYQAIGYDSGALLGEEPRAEQCPEVVPSKLLANIFAAQGDLRVTDTALTLHLDIAARNDERRAIHALFSTINSQNLSFPGDLQSRPLRFASDI